MTNKTFALFALSIFVFAFLVAGVSAENLGKWTLNITANNQTSVAADIGVNTNVVSGSFTAGLGVTQVDVSGTPGNFDITANGATAQDWDSTNSTAAALANEYYQVTITPNLGFNYVLSSITFDTITSDAGGMDFAIRTSADNFASDIATGAVLVTTSAISKTGLKVSSPASGVLTVRIYGLNAANTVTDTFSIKNLVLSGDLVPVEVVECLATAGNGNNQMTVDDVDLTVEEGYGEDDEWFPLDLVNIETNVEYNGDSDFEMKNIEVVWGLFDRDTNKWIIDDAEKDFDLEGGSDQDVVIQVKLDEKIDKLATGDIVAYAIATGEDEEQSDLETCEYKDASVSMKSENALILDNLQYPTTAVQCSEEVLVTAKIWNIGDDKLENNYILVANTELGINNQRIEVGDVNDFDDSSLEFTFTVPADAVEKSYNILFSLYDEDDDIFEVNDEETKFTVPLSVSGGCVGTSSPVTVSASLVSGGKSGSDLVVRATITNSGTSTANYTLNAAGYGQWADTATLSETTFSLNAGQSKDVTITLATKSSVSGEQTFNIEVLSGNQLVMTQPVSVVLERSGFLSSITGGAIGGNGTLWLIGLINVILVIAIIMVAVRFFRK